MFGRPEIVSSFLGRTTKTFSPRRVSSILASGERYMSGSTDSFGTSDDLTQDSVS